MCLLKSKYVFWVLNRNVSFANTSILGGSVYFKIWKMCLLKRQICLLPKHTFRIIQKTHFKRHISKDTFSKDTFQKAYFVFKRHISKHTFRFINFSQAIKILKCVFCNFNMSFKKADLRFTERRICVLKGRFVFWIPNGNSWPRTWNVKCVFWSNFCVFWKVRSVFLQNTDLFSLKNRTKRVGGKKLYRTWKFDKSFFI